MLTQRQGIYPYASAYNYSEFLLFVRNQLIFLFQKKLHKHQRYRSTVLFAPRKRVMYKQLLLL